MTNEQQFPQPPPYPQREKDRQGDFSETRGWVRIQENNGRYEVYWKGRSDVMVLMTHTLCKAHAEAMQRDLVKVLKRFNGIPFIESSNVQHSEVEDYQQTQGNREGGLEPLQKEGGKT